MNKYYIYWERWIEEESARNMKPRGGSVGIQVRDDEGSNDGEMRIWLDVRTFQESEWNFRKNTI